MTNPARIARTLREERERELRRWDNERCQLTDLFPAECACPAHRNITEEPPSDRKRATFRGTCRCCLVTKIEPGDLIEPYEGAWRKVDCDA